MQARDIDALIFPGGLGAAKNLSSFASDGSDCTVNPQVERLIGEMIDAGKPVAAICIAPAMLSRVLGKRGLTAEVTIGTDAQTAAAIQKMGLRHKDCPCTACVVDSAHRVVTTPAYMLGKGPAEVFEGIRALVSEVLRLA